jgi:Malectin domain
MSLQNDKQPKSKNRHPILPTGEVVDAKNTLQSFDAVAGTNQLIPSHPPVVSGINTVRGSNEAKYPINTAEEPTIFAVAIDSVSNIVHVELSPQLVPSLNVVAIDADDKSARGSCYMQRSTVLLFALSATFIALGLGLYIGVSESKSSFVPNPTPTAPVALSTAAPISALTYVPTRLATALPTAAPTADFDSNDTNVREPLFFLNCGGPSLQFNNHVWAADQLHPQFIMENSLTYSRDTDPLCQEFVSPVNSTNDDLSVVRDGNFDALFCSERFFPLENGGGFEIPVPAAGEYRVELHFREDFYNMSRQRVFNISVEDELIREDFDILLRAGGPYLPTKVVSTMLVEDGALSISIRASIGNPTINALALYRVLEQQ